MLKTEQPFVLLNEMQDAALHTNGQSEAQSIVTLMMAYMMLLVSLLLEDQKIVYTSRFVRVILAQGPC